MKQKKEQTLNDIMNSSERAMNYAALQKEVQQPKLMAVKSPIKDPFKKTDEEKTQVANFKKQLPKTRGYKFSTYLHQSF
jgi:ERCC4-related helicase